MAARERKEAPWSAPPRHVPHSATLIGVHWHRSSWSTAMNNCLEAASLRSGALAVRDSKNTAGPALLFSPPSWAAFVEAVGNGTFPTRS
ncbi:DUF397 domain-containing protein [Streptomyces sp. H27-D2]|uniref:DUF397 domain-containing protein n=1 Tax=Streptomyces sp. H27-D2 TaxID=3046304 RepID=UPI002DB5BECC|nr:DUF397 domain-containing protein [Streptomyces sp. H27-D2]MEC4017618.1 DUF397 domain-containing protein [Streptomyces sp. H27-D2]